MNREDINLLRLMEEVDSNAHYSQRELARRLNVSLGLVNSFIKRLVNKGYFKIKTLPKNRVRYLLTPKGMAQKSKLTVEYLRYSVNFYKSVKSLLLEIYNRMEQKGIKKIVFYGAGEVAELSYLYLQLTDIKLVGLVDEENVGQQFFEIKIDSVASLKRKNWDAILITRLEQTKEVTEALVEQGIPKERIVVL